MRNDKHIAIKLRRKGFAYNKISQELDVPKSTLSDWFSKLKWSTSIRSELARRANYVARKRLRLINKQRREEWERWREEFRKSARGEFAELAKNPLFIAGLSLYWGEGDRRLENGVVRLINTDPGIISLFSKFLLDVVGLPREKVKSALILYPDLSEKECRSFWSKASGIPESQFHKTQVIRGRHPTRKTAYGMCTIYVSSRGLKEKIFVWLDLLYKSLSNK